MRVALLNLKSFIRIMRTIPSDAIFPPNLSPIFFLRDIPHKYNLPNEGSQNFISFTIYYDFSQLAFSCHFFLLGVCVCVCGLVVSVLDCQS